MSAAPATEETRLIDGVPHRLIERFPCHTPYVVDGKVKHVFTHMGSRWEPVEQPDGDA